MSTKTKNISISEGYKFIEVFNQWNMHGDDGTPVPCPFPQQFWACPNFSESRSALDLVQLLRFPLHHQRAISSSSCVR